MFKKTLIALAIAATMSGCALKSFVDKAAKVNDDVLKAAEFSICKGASIGSVKRRFNTPELAKLWKDFCQEEQGFTP